MMRAIKKFAREVAERFEPETIILFGSHAYGTPHADSDVDILVVMPARNELDMALAIDEAIAPCSSNRLPFALRLPAPNQHDRAARLRCAAPTFWRP